MKEKEAADAHFTVDKQNISLWPQEPPPKSDLSAVLRKPLSCQVAFVCLSLVLVTSIVLQAVFYPRLVAKILDVESDAQMLRGRVENISTLGSVLEKDRGRVEEAEGQMLILNKTLAWVHSQILSLETSLEVDDAQIRILIKTREKVEYLNAKIPELQRDLDKASTLNAQVQRLQTSLENVNMMLQGQ
ncbi:C-type lectin domain family 4 member K, partial [Sigmodon hispidus]